MEMGELLIIIGFWVAISVLRLGGYKLCLYCFGNFSRFCEYEEYSSTAKFVHDKINILRLGGGL